MEQHFVTFYSAGTFFAEEDTKPIDRWDTDIALEMSLGIKQRYGATPYAFVFSTRENKGTLDSVESARSSRYYINCKISTLEEIKAKNDPNDRILITNMECNNFNAVVRSTKGWGWAQPLEKGDVLLEQPNDQ